ncbi:MAG: hypothetical protein AB7F64_07295 [Gammaproteobacteria bacterium]
MMNIEFTAEQFDVVNQLTETVASSKAMTKVAQSITTHSLEYGTLYDYANALHHLLGLTLEYCQRLSASFGLNVMDDD